MSDALLEIRDLTKRFALRRGLFQPTRHLIAVDAVNVSVARGKSLGVVGESGSGKSTLARMIMALIRPDAGQIKLNGEDLWALSPGVLRLRRRQFQMIFQDPRGSLDPRMTVDRIIAEPLDVAEPKLGHLRAERITQAVEAVGLDRSALRRFPHEFSGGQRQRIAIARALVTEPALVVADEPVSALDVSVQAQVLNLMMDLQESRGLTYMFISHDLAVVEHMADDVIVMYRGRVVEQGPANTLFQTPAHPYTRALVDAVSDVEAKPVEVPLKRQTANDGPNQAQRTVGCAYASDCPFAEAACGRQTPALLPLADTPNRTVACLKPLRSPAV